jgi:hypothetical protein
MISIARTANLNATRWRDRHVVLLWTSTHAQKRESRAV